MRTLGDVAKMANRLPAELQRAQLRGVSKAALTVTQGIRSEIRAVTGGSNRLSGVGRRGARVGARYDVKGSINPTALIIATGPMQLLEHDTRPHGITPKRRRRGGRAKALKLTNGQFARSAQHPGTKAKTPFEKGWKRTAPETGAIFDREVQSAIGTSLK